MNTVPVKPSFLAMGATRADAVTPERYPAPRWPVHPLNRIPRKWNLKSASSTASSTLKERLTPILMVATLGE